jgi:hypothetical protein
MLDLLRYIKEWNADVPIPDVRARGYLALSWLIGPFPAFHVENRLFSNFKVVTL